jgi:hypothetical protein
VLSGAKNLPKVKNRQTRPIPEVRTATTSFLLVSATFRIAIAICDNPDVKDWHYFRRKIVIRIIMGDLAFRARLEAAAAPKTVAVFEALLPYEQPLIQARWSGESAWVPLGDLDLGLAIENATSYPSPGEILLYPGGFSETEILVPYGRTCFASTLGQLAGNHFLTIIEGNERLPELGRRVTWEGAQTIRFERESAS